MTYILVMTTALYIGRAGVSVQTAEFNNKQACESAGKQQKTALENLVKANSDNFYTFLCVPKG